MDRRQRQVLHDKKWIKFLGRTWLFRHVPFAEFVLAAGSLATGAVNESSDFDVIVGVRSGRIFTARFFSVAAFGLFGWRRKKLSHKEAASDKVCLNHFVTAGAYRLSPPRNRYWQDLYASLVPVYGSDEKVRDFFSANNSWLASEVSYADDLRHEHRFPSGFKSFFEKFLAGAAGDRLERWLKKVQVARIERGIKDEAGHKPRILYSDSELEFHPDTRRTEAV